MNAIVHFSVGAGMGLLLLAAFDRDQRVPVVATYLSGLWAMMPDGWWVFYALGVIPFPLGHAVHDHVLMNVFWLHPTLDAMQGPDPRREMFLALSFMLSAALGYHLRLNTGVLSE